MTLEGAASWVLEDLCRRQNDQCSQCRIVISTSVLMTKARDLPTFGAAGVHNCVCISVGRQSSGHMALGKAKVAFGHQHGCQQAMLSHFVKWRWRDFQMWLMPLTGKCLSESCSTPSNVKKNYIVFPISCLLLNYGLLVW